MEKYKVCCLTYKKLDTLVTQAISKIDDSELEFIVLEGLGESLIERVKVQLVAGVDVIIGGGANARMVREITDVPVIDYRITAFDYLNAIDKAFVMGRHIAITSYKSPISNELEQYMRRLGIAVTNLIYYKVEDLGKQIQEICCDVIVGAAHAVELAVDLGKKGVLIYPGEEAIMASIQQAKLVAKEVRKRNIKALYTSAVIKNSTNGLVLVDTAGKIMESNKSARYILGMKEPFFDKYANDILPFCHLNAFLERGKQSETGIVKINDTEVLQTWIRMMTNNRVYIGCVGIFSKVSDFNSAQMEYLDKQRKSLGQKGFTAKYTFKDILGSSKAIHSLIEEARLYASSNSSILLCGETGVGKELFAQSIHNESNRKDWPFVAINCAALPENLLETELFGYDDGTFTGGRKGGKKGLFELADKGTMFLDEIGELSPSLQARLLRVLQEKEIMRVGGDRVIPTDVRIVSATNRNLEREPAHSFRKDLLYRLSVLELRIPPLRERDKDVTELFLHFLAKQEPMYDCYAELPEILYRILQMYSWPGNIRELQNIFQRFMLYSCKQQIASAKGLQQCIIRAIGEDRLFEDTMKKYCHGDPHDLTAGAIDELCALMAYSKEQIGEKLGISRTTIWRIGKNKTIS